MESRLMNAALAEVVQLMDEFEFTQEEAIALVVRALDLTPEQAQQLTDAYNAL